MIMNANFLDDIEAVKDELTSVSELNALLDAIEDMESMAEEFGYDKSIESVVDTLIALDGELEVYNVEVAHG